jgi:hypothetical protein
MACSGTALLFFNFILVTRPEHIGLLNFLCVRSRPISLLTSNRGCVFIYGIYVFAHTHQHKLESDVFQLIPVPPDFLETS